MQAVILIVSVCLSHAESKELKALEEQVDSVWKKRMTDGDPIEASLQREKVVLLLVSKIPDSDPVSVAQGYIDRYNLNNPSAIPHLLLEDEFLNEARGCLRGCERV